MTSSSSSEIRRHKCLDSSSKTRTSLDVKGVREFVIKSNFFNRKRVKRPHDFLKNAHLQISVDHHVRSPSRNKVRNVDSMFYFT